MYVVIKLFQSVISMMNGHVRIFNKVWWKI